MASTPPTDAETTHKATPAPLERRSYALPLVLLLVLATAGRIVLALLPLGNDEVYYWELARHLSLSYYDHPPMTALVIRLFTMGLRFDNELMLRLGPMLFAAGNTIIIYRLGARVKSPRAGWYAALLYTTSIYTSVIAGVFILPDAPELLFWMLSLLLLLEALPPVEISRRERLLMLLAGITIGLAMLSKYHGVFLWLGALLYIVLYHRRWLLQPQLYLAGLLSIVCFLPVIIWNVRNDFISLTWQSSRVAVTEGIQPQYLATELLGQFAYQNPVNFVLIVLALIALVRGRRYLEQEHLRLLLLLSLPVILVFTSFSIFRQTLPHWTGPGYVGLILLAGAWLAEKRRGLLPVSLLSAGAVIIAAGALAMWMICCMPYQFGERQDWDELGKGDALLDMHGWDQIRLKTARIILVDEALGRAAPDSPIISFRWFPASHLDYYVAVPLRRKLLVYNDLGALHDFAWSNHERGHIEPGQDAWFINLTNYPRDPHELYGPYFESIVEAGDIEVNRGGVPVRRAVVYRMENCLERPPVPGFEDVVQ